MSVIRDLHLPIDVEMSTPSKQPNPQKYQKHQAQKYNKRKLSNPSSLPSSASVSPSYSDTPLYSQHSHSNNQHPPTSDGGYHSTHQPGRIANSFPIFTVT